MIDFIYGFCLTGESEEVRYNLNHIGRLEKTKQQILQDVSLYRIPDDLEDLMKILVGILE